MKQFGHIDSEPQGVNKGFTITELLFVVGIIAILAAVAIPNLLAAQVRAKVARVKADMAGIATAIEAYWVDYGSLPPHAWGRNPRPTTNNPSQASSLEYLELRAFRSLTTPVAHIGGGMETFVDPFSVGRATHYGYQTPDLDLPLDSTRPFYQMAFGSSVGASEHVVYLLSGFRVAPHSVQRTGYVLTSVGPDGLHQTSVALWGATDPPDWQGTTASGRPEAFWIYDPSNGAASNGDLIRVGGQPPQWFKTEGWPLLP